MGKIELLAPAGDNACLRAAVNAGADAVYLGAEAYGARAYASNFKSDELCEAIYYAHLFGVKVYLTVNTLVKERELTGLCNFISPFYEAGLDGVIVQDFGVLKLLKENFPGLLLHASTQMCVTGVYGAELLKEYGVCRVVPARELSLAELKAIKEETGIEIEAFVHGAMCYAYSGQCLFSSFLGGRSGNRGRCAGPCRLPYSAFGQKNVYPLSLKDLCALPILDKLADAGIDSFKIEGRMKNAYYVAGVTAIYRKYLDRYEALRLKEKTKKTKKETKFEKEFEVEKEDLLLLQKLYVRTGQETGYYQRHNGPELITLRDPGYVSAGEDEFTQIKEQFLDRDRKLALQGRLSARTGEPMRFTVWDENGREVTETAEKPVEKAISRPMRMADIKKQLSKTGNTPFLFRDISVIIDENVFIPVYELNELRRRTLEKMKALLTESRKRSAAGKTECAGMPAATVGKLTAAGETTAANNQTTVAGEAAACESVAAEQTVAPRQNKNKGIRIAVTTAEQLSAVLAYADTCAHDRIAGIELAFSLLWEADEREEAVCAGLSKLPVYLCLPTAFRKRAAEACDDKLTDDKLWKFAGFYCGNPDALAYLEHRFAKASPAKDAKRGRPEIFADYSFYTCNAEAVAFLEQWNRKRSAAVVSGFVGSYELNLYEWQELLQGCADRGLSRFKKECLVYGHIPFMQTAGCVKKTFGSCDGKNTVVYLKDRMGKSLPVRNDCRICANTIYNSVPLSLFKERRDLECDYERISFTIESADGVRSVLDSFLSGAPLPDTEYTRGHFKKGMK